MRKPANPRLGLTSRFTGAPIVIPVVSLSSDNELCSLSKDFLSFVSMKWLHYSEACYFQSVEKQHIFLQLLTGLNQ